MVKLYNGQYAEDFLWAARFILDIYKANINNESRDHIEYFHRFSFVIEFIFKALVICGILTCFTFISYIFIMYVFENELVVFVPHYVPYFDETTPIGYAITTTYVLSLLFVFMLIYVAVEIFVVILIVSSHIFTKLISSEINQINVDLEQEKRKMLLIVGRLINVFLMHQEMDGYKRF